MITSPFKPVTREPTSKWGGFKVWRDRASAGRGAGRSPHGKPGFWKRHAEENKGMHPIVRGLTNSEARRRGLPTYGKPKRGLKKQFDPDETARLGFNVKYRKGARIPNWHGSRLQRTSSAKISVGENAGEDTRGRRLAARNEKRWARNDAGYPTTERGQHLGPNNLRRLTRSLPGQASGAAYPGYSLSRYGRRLDKHVPAGWKRGRAAAKSFSSPSDNWDKKEDTEFEDYLRGTNRQPKRRRRLVNNKAERNHDALMRHEQLQEDASGETHNFLNSPPPRRMKLEPGQMVQNPGTYDDGPDPPNQWRIVDDFPEEDWLGQVQANQRERQARINDSLAGLNTNVVWMNRTRYSRGLPGASGAWKRGAGATTKKIPRYGDSDEAWETRFDKFQDTVKDGSRGDDTRRVFHKIRNGELDSRYRKPTRNPRKVREHDLAAFRDTQTRMGEETLNNEMIQDFMKRQDMPGAMYSIQEPDEETYTPREMELGPEGDPFRFGIATHAGRVIEAKNLPMYRDYIRRQRRAMRESNIPPSRFRLPGGSGAWRRKPKGATTYDELNAPARDTFDMMRDMELKRTPMNDINRRLANIDKKNLEWGLADSHDIISHLHSNRGTGDEYPLAGLVGMSRNPREVRDDLHGPDVLEHLGRDMRLREVEPQVYINAANQLWHNEGVLERDTDKTDVKNLREHWRQGGVLDAPWLGVSEKKTPEGMIDVSNHNGRHRAYMARDAGVKRMPVLLQKSGYQNQVGRGPSKKLWTRKSQGRDNYLLPEWDFYSNRQTRDRYHTEDWKTGPPPGWKHGSGSAGRRNWKKKGFSRQQKEHMDVDEEMQMLKRAWSDFHDKGRMTYTSPDMSNRLEDIARLVDDGILPQAPLYPNHKEALKQGWSRRDGIYRNQSPVGVLAGDLPFHAARVKQLRGDMRGRNHRRSRNVDKAGWKLPGSGSAGRRRFKGFPGRNPSWQQQMNIDSALGGIMAQRYSDPRHDPSDDPVWMKHVREQGGALIHPADFEGHRARIRMMRQAHRDDIHNRTHQPGFPAWLPGAGGWRRGMGAESPTDRWDREEKERTEEALNPKPEGGPNIGSPFDLPEGDPIRDVYEAMERAKNTPPNEREYFVNEAVGGEIDEETGELMTQDFGDWLGEVAEYDDEDSQHEDDKWREGWHDDVTDYDKRKGDGNYTYNPWRRGPPTERTKPPVRPGQKGPQRGYWLPPGTHGQFNFGGDSRLIRRHEIMEEPLDYWWFLNMDDNDIYPQMNDPDFEDNLMRSLRAHRANRIRLSRAGNQQNILGAWPGYEKDTLPGASGPRAPWKGRTPARRPERYRWRGRTRKSYPEDNLRTAETHPDTMSANPGQLRRELARGVARKKASGRGFKRAVENAGRMKRWARGSTGLTTYPSSITRVPRPSRLLYSGRGMGAAGRLRWVGLPYNASGRSFFNFKVSPKKRAPPADKGKLDAYMPKGGWKRPGSATGFDRAGYRFRLGNHGMAMRMYNKKVDALRGRLRDLNRQRDPSISLPTMIYARRRLGQMHDEAVNAGHREHALGSELLEQGKAVNWGHGFKPPRNWRELMNKASGATDEWDDEERRMDEGGQPTPEDWSRDPGPDRRDFGSLSPDERKNLRGGRIRDMELQEDEHGWPWQGAHPEDMERAETFQSQEDARPPRMDTIQQSRRVRRQPPTAMTGPLAKTGSVYAVPGKPGYHTWSGRAQVRPTLFEEPADENVNQEDEELGLWYAPGTHGDIPYSGPEMKEMGAHHSGALPVSNTFWRYKSWLPDEIDEMADKMGIPREEAKEHIWRSFVRGNQDMRRKRIEAYKKGRDSGIIKYGDKINAGMSNYGYGFYDPTTTYDQQLDLEGNPTGKVGPPKPGSFGLFSGSGWRRGHGARNFKTKEDYRTFLDEGAHRSAEEGEYFDNDFKRWNRRAWERTGRPLYVKDAYDKSAPKGHRRMTQAEFNRRKGLKAQLRRPTPWIKKMASDCGDGSCDTGSFRMIPAPQPIDKSGNPKTKHAFSDYYSSGPEHGGAPPGSSTEREWKRLTREEDIENRKRAERAAVNFPAKWAEMRRDDPVFRADDDRRLKSLRAWKRRARRLYLSRKKPRGSARDGTILDWFYHTSNPESNRRLGYPSLAHATYPSTEKSQHLPGLPRRNNAPYSRTVIPFTDGIGLHKRPQAASASWKRARTSTAQVPR